MFTRFGLADTLATTWLPAAHNLLRAAGFEATLNDAARVAELAGRLMFAGAGTVLRAAGRYPVPAVAVLAGAVLLAWRTGWLSPDP